jgi:hypothetical protein
MKHVVYEEDIHMESLLSTRSLRMGFLVRRVAEVARELMN